MRDRSSGPRGSIRGELSGFVGRRAELGRVRAVLAGARLVTLTGPGGIGKTRLAVQAAAEVRRSFRDGAWMAELAGLRDPGLLAAEVARAFGLLDQSASWAVALLADRLAGRHALLVLDNCEHLLDACAVLVGALLRACPDLRILATSQHIRGNGRGGVKMARVRVAAGGGRCRCVVAVRAAVQAPGWESDRGLPVTPADFGIRTRPQA